MTNQAANILDNANILVIDDAPEQLAQLQAMLSTTYQVSTAQHGDLGLAMAKSSSPPDLILLSISSPDADGYAVCRQLKVNPKTRAIPILCLSAPMSVASEEMGLALGMADYITTPVSPPILLARVRMQLALKASADFLHDQTAMLEAQVSKRTREVESIQDVTILLMASLAETRDADTSNHLLRTQHYVRILARKLARHPRFSAYLTSANIQLLFKSAPLHDIGKVGIPDRILLKPGKLTTEEFEIMKTHTTLGRDAIEEAQQSLGIEVAFLTMAKEIAYSHQEKWDGSGYPLGLAGDLIPISARLMALADVYDALISRRTYKEPMPHTDAVNIIAQIKGKHFDPDVVDAFLEAHSQFDAVAQAFDDSVADLDKKVKYLTIAGV